MTTADLIAAIKGHDGSDLDQVYRLSIDAGAQIFDEDGRRIVSEDHFDAQREASIHYTDGSSIIAWVESDCWDVRA